MLYESHNAPGPYPTMQHFVTGMCTYGHISFTQWCIVGYFFDALYDLWNGFIGRKIVANKLTLRNIGKCIMIYIAQKQALKIVIIFTGYIMSYERYGFPNHRPFDCFFNSLFRLTSKKKHQSSALPTIPYREINRWSLDSPHKGPVMPKAFPVKYTRPITTIFCTRHDSVTVVTCAKYRCDRSSIFETRAFWIFIEFRIRSKYA